MQAADNDTSAFPAGFSVENSGAGSPDRFRSDETLVSNLLNNAGDRDGRFIVIPNVL
jgi:hypothetical protein